LNDIDRTSPIMYAKNVKLQIASMHIRVKCY